MRIIGCDLHARQQTLAMLDSTTGEVKTTLRSEWRSALKKDLTGLTLLEMSGKTTYQELSERSHAYPWAHRAKQ
jgi:hypothetical protein